MPDGSGNAVAIILLGGGTVFYARDSGGINRLNANDSGGISPRTGGHFSRPVLLLTPRPLPTFPSLWLLVPMLQLQCVQSVRPLRALVL